MQFPTTRWSKQPGQTVITVKRPTENTEYLAARHISSRRGNNYPFLCYKWSDPGEKFKDVSTDNLWQADWRRWDDHYRSFAPFNPEPSSGTCAVYSVVERWQPEEIGLIGFDFLLDNNRDWFHDAEAELKSIESLVTIIDLRDGSERNTDNGDRPC